MDLWPAAGWITGGLTALTLWGALQVLPPFAAVVTAFAVRLLLTGALHEDGLADFIDGTGGGSTRERILEIMKDSRIGSYGVIGLVIYFISGYPSGSRPQIHYTFIFVRRYVCNFPYRNPCEESYCRKKFFHNLFVRSIW